MVELCGSRGADVGLGWVDTGRGFPEDSLDGAEGEGLWLTGTLATRSGPF